MVIITTQRIFETDVGEHIQRHLSVPALNFKITQHVQVYNIKSH